MKAAMAFSCMAVAVLSACGDMAKLSVSDGTGPKPVLPAPVVSLLPTVNIAPAQPWPPGTAPSTAPAPGPRTDGALPRLVAGGAARIQATRMAVAVNQSSFCKP